MTALASALAAPPPEVDLGRLLETVSGRVEAYYARAQSLVCTETVHLQPVEADFTPREMGRTLVYDLRVEWDQAADGDDPPEPRVVRQLRTVNGRAPKPKDEPGCMDPKPVSPDALALLLPSHRNEYVFRFAGPGRVARQEALMIDYKGRTAGPPDIRWKGDCVSIDLPGHYAGRVWIDAATNDVLRVDEHLASMFEFRIPPKQARFGASDLWVIERADTSTRYRRVAFHDPDETLVLPESIETFQVIRNSGVPRLRVRQTFADYHRFMTGARIVKPGGAGL